MAILHGSRLAARAAVLSRSSLFARTIHSTLPKWDKQPAGAVLDPMTDELTALPDIEVNFRAIFWPSKINSRRKPA